MTKEKANIHIYPRVTLQKSNLAPSLRGRAGVEAVKKEDLRIVFMGTPEFAVGTLKALVEGDYNVVAVVTQPDKPVGRHQDTLQMPAVKKYALEHSLPVLQPVKMKDEAFVEELRSYNADLQVVVAFRMLPEVVWAMPRFGTFNVHAALLPQYRGAAPINWAIINGETMTGVTTFFLDHDIDTGRIIEQREFPIPDDANLEYVYDGLMELGAEIAISTVSKVIESDGQIDSISQDEIVNGKLSNCKLHHAPKIFKDTCEINWNLPSKKIYDFIRGLSPYPGTWTNLVSATEKPLVMKVFKAAKTNISLSAKTNEALYVNSASVNPGTIIVDGNHLYITTADNLLDILELQISGKKRMLTKDFLNGFKKIASYKAEVKN